MTRSVVQGQLAFLDVGMHQLGCMQVQKHATSSLLNAGMVCRQTACALDAACMLC